MLETLKNAWKMPELRKKLLFTLLIIVIFRVGAALPVPFLDPSALQQMISSNSGNLFGYLNMLTGGAFSQATLFAMSVTPYINASIIIQLLTIAIPYLERLSKEGEEGRKKINKITRWTSVVLAAIQALAYYLTLRGYNAVTYVNGVSGVFAAAIIIVSFIAGTTLIMWLGEQLDKKGVGNGISIILFAGIISRGPAAITTLWNYLRLAVQGETKYFFFVPVIVALFVVVIGFIVVMTNAERRIPVQYAKRVVGRKMYGGQSSHIPVKVNMSGVMPIIFASSLIAIPGTIAAFVNPTEGGFWDKVLGVFDYTGWLYAIVYFVLIIAFNYFYVAVQYNPIEIANNLRKNSGAIPGIRPGKPTSDFIARIVSRVTLLGALFLGVIAVLPIALSAITGMNVALGGTSILILVSVALDTTRSLESQMMMRHYKGFLE